MGCTASKNAGQDPRTVIASTYVPGGKAGARLNRALTLDYEDGEGKDGEIQEVNVDQITATVNNDRRRLSIMKTSHDDPKRRSRSARSLSRNSGGESVLLDGLEDDNPGEDIGNGAFGENGEHSVLNMRYSCVTRPGNDPAKNQKENQDTYCVHAGLDKDPESLVCCVFDGHGPNGAMASNYVRERLIKIWTEMGLGRKSCQDEEEIRRILHNGCVEVNHKLATSSIDVYVSGSTGILGVVKKDMLYVANVGDSRAVLGRINPSTKRLEAVDLSDDQKPDRPDEQARIERYGGRVFEWGVPRVWQRDEDMPGLAMARSFGDLAAESVGVYAEPEISVTKLTEHDQFLIFATDGVWEFLSSSDIIKIIGRHMAKSPPHIAARDAAVEVIKTSVAKWNSIEDVVDDSTCVIIALNCDDEN